jgi:hypothetical protein
VITERQVRTLADKYAPKLGLGSYAITVELYPDGEVPINPNAVGGSCTAPGVQEIVLLVNSDEGRQEEEGGLPMTVVHELLHCVISDVGARVTKSEETLLERLAKAFTKE